MNSNNIFFDFNFNNNYNTYITININKGLGHQLFKIATAYSYAIENNKSLIFINDINNKTYWDSLFSNKLNILDKKEFDNIEFIKEKELKPYIYSEFQEYTTHKNILLDGDFLSFKYFDNNNTKNFLRHLIYSCDDYMYKAYDIYNSIKDYFNNCSDNDIVSMHFRKNIDNALDINYYIKALEKIDDNVNNIVVFSDNIDWCKKNISSDIFNKKNIYIVDIDNDEIEFILLSFIKHNIISNSTYSLMASYISYYDTAKTIIAPIKWLSNINVTEIYHKDITYII